ncbi:hypothetical protein CSB45_01390 [candidate division KSB3 bacterium]|uniref:histidine kinase n=1 Tax=candidate division KSB3 bacterium TaxID=2044937 RepID=A0A2G6EBF3_9BACT|nr:MAG: hypothetical protein CSB45_01390 [candidate division KSB3 bacterium]PIE30750.1 MAG: hypothetical protein CSA57_01960 [candidate division KSB3 bacterium]
MKKSGALECVFNSMYRRYLSSRLTEEGQFRARFFFFFSTSASSGILGIAVYHMMQGHLPEAGAEALIALALGTCLLLGSRVRSEKGLGFVFLASVSLCHVFAVSMMAHGGDDGSRLLWMYLLPLPACVLLSRRESLVFLSLSFLAIVVVFSGAGALPASLSHELRSKNYAIETRIRFLLSFSMLSVMASGCGTLYRRKQKEDCNEQPVNQKRHSSELPAAGDATGSHERSGELRQRIPSLTETGPDAIAAADPHTSLHDAVHLRSRLQEHSDFLTAMLDNAPVAIYAKDLEGKYLFINKKGLEWLRVSPDEMSGKTDYELFTRDIAEKSRREDQEILRTGSPLTFERVQTIERELFAARLDKYPLRAEDGRLYGVCGLTYDISSYKQNEQKLQAWLDELETQVEEYAESLERQGTELKHFTETVPYQLREPLKDINQLTSMLVKNYATKLDRRGKDISSLLVNRIKRLNRYIDGIIQYASAGRSVEHEQQIDLNELIREIVEQLAPPPEMQIWIEHTLPVIIAGKVGMKQIFLHLLSNAINVMDTPYGEIAVDCEEHSDAWTFAVVDNGPGIDKKDHEKIFRFFQTLAPRDERERPGIGLALVKKLVEHYGGQIWVESSRGKGAQFYFTLPKTGL